ncbi:MAG: Ada metal-binding domain-containing protein [Patescibacteria group bacterium]|nr:Ada metal-binding domain-containing protein [Patescibacteria group bacterium]
MRAIVKWFQENQNRVALIIGMILVAAISFAGGILVSPQEKKEPLVLSEGTSKVEPFSLMIKEIKGSSVFLKVDPRATVKVDEEIIKGDGEGNFGFDFRSGEKLTIYDEDNVITLDLNALKQQSEGVVAGEAKKGGENTKQTMETVRPNISSGSVELKKEVPREGQLVGSKNSTKYHLPSCRFAKNIKPENQVWFSSKEEAESKGYKPCGTCIK